MPRRLILALLPIALFSASISFAQTANDTIAPTIPESQIEPRKFSSPYEFLSAATSVDEFEIKAAALANTLAESAEVKQFAAQAATEHAALTQQVTEAGKADKVEIAAPSVDGDQQGLLSKLEALKGAEFDATFVEGQLFVHQRAIAMYRGYATENNNIGKFAAATLPKVVDHYGELLKIAETMKIGGAAQQPAAQQ